MKGKRLGLAFMAMFIGAAVSVADLDTTPIQNPSFESVEDGGTPGGWGYIIDDWYENEVPNSRANFYEKAAGIGLVGDGDLWVGTETGGMFYQAIGTVDDSQTYEVSALLGARWGNSFKTGKFSLYASADASGAADGVDLGTFATELSSIEVTTADGVPTGNPGVYAVALNLTTGTGHAGEVLWLAFGSVEGKDYFDNIGIQQIPEPATFGMVAIFGGGILFFRRLRFF